MSEAREFALQLSNEWQAARDDLVEAVSGIGLLVLSGVVRKSPVDTGRFRGNWIVSLGIPSEIALDIVDKAGGDTIRKGADVLTGYKDFLPIYVQNNLPYATTLENGRVTEINSRTGFPQWFGSIQAPNGMAALTVAEINAQLDAGQ